MATNDATTYTPCTGWLLKMMNVHARFPLLAIHKAIDAVEGTKKEKYF